MTITSSAQAQGARGGDRHLESRSDARRRNGNRGQDRSRDARVTPSVLFSVVHAGNKPRVSDLFNTFPLLSYFGSKRYLKPPGSPLHGSFGVQPGHSGPPPRFVAFSDPYATLGLVLILPAPTAQC